MTFIRIPSQNHPTIVNNFRFLIPSIKRKIPIYQALKLGKIDKKYSIILHLLTIKQISESINSDKTVKRKFKMRHKRCFWPFTFRPSFERRKLYRIAVKFDYDFIDVYQPYKERWRPETYCAFEWRMRKTIDTTYHGRWKVKKQGAFKVDVKGDHYYCKMYLELIKELTYREYRNLKEFKNEFIISENRLQLRNFRGLKILGKNWKREIKLREESPPQRKYTIIVIVVAVVLVVFIGAIIIILQSKIGYIAQYGGHRTFMGTKKIRQKYNKYKEYVTRKDKLSLGSASLDESLLDDVNENAGAKMMNLINSYQ
ncbi:hypothetical protein SNEBB_010412 [Seison nebaliae]|nr:hypothetical protein SNEBB_010412 [Seison nebaliae]